MGGYRQEDRCYETKKSIFGGFFCFFSPSFWSFVVIVGWAFFLSIGKRILMCFSRKQAPVNKNQKIAVVGGGIAGSTTAWVLNKNGFDVVLYETRETLGGNAKTHLWGEEKEQEIGEEKEKEKGGFLKKKKKNKGKKEEEREEREKEGEEEEGAVTGLSVLAWPEKYFHNYMALLEELGIEQTDVSLPFALRDPDVCDFQHGKELEGGIREDAMKWCSLVETVRRVNVFFTKSDSSLYAYSVWNPFNVLTVHFTATKVFGISQKFWESVIVPIYSSSFLTKDLESLPCSILPAVDDMISIAKIPTMRTWKTSSKDVFARLTQGVEVKGGRAVLEVRPLQQNNGSYKHLVRDSNNDFDYFDKVVFACSSDQALRCLRTPSSLQKQLLTHISYVDDHDHTFSRGIIHRDNTVIPEDIREELISNCSNYIRTYREPKMGPKKGEKLGHVIGYENTFILSWVPFAKGKTDKPMLVTYNSQHENINHVQGTVSNLRAHPDLSLGNLLLAQMIGLVQGERGIYFCGSYTTPGNGHDLSLLSGLIVAHDIGAAYPFENNPKAKADFDRLRGLMHL